MELERKPLAEKDGQFHEHPGTFLGVSYKAVSRDSSMAYTMNSPADASGNCIRRAYFNKYMAALVYARTQRGHGGLCSYSLGLCSY